MQTMKKRLLSLFLIFVCAILSFQITVFAVVSEKPFTDVFAANQYSEAINYLYENGIIDGYTDGTFKPENEINRAEFLKILVAAKIGEPDAVQYNNCFTDVKTDWYAPSVCYAKSVEWIVGYEDGSFKPEQTITKVEALKMILNSQGIEVPKYAESSPFTDVSKDEWYAPFVVTAYELGLLEETGDTLVPAENMKRQSVSQILYKTLTLEAVLTKSDKDMIKTLESEWVAYDNGLVDLSKLNCKYENFVTLEGIFDTLKANYGEDYLAEMKGDYFFNTVNFPTDVLDLYAYDNAEYFVAAYSGCTEFIKNAADEEIMDPPIDLSMSIDGTSLFNFAVLGTNKELAEYLISEGEDVNAVYNGYTFLEIYASIDGSKEILKFLKAIGADADLKNSFGETPIYASITYDAYENVEFLADDWASVTVSDDEGKTPLHHAANLAYLENQVAIIELLLSKGASISAKNSYGETPLHAAVAGGSLEAVKVLVSNGADINIEDNNGQTPLELASYLEEFEMVSAMME